MSKEATDKFKELNIKLTEANKRLSKSITKLTKAIIRIRDCKDSGLRALIIGEALDEEL